MHIRIAALLLLGCSTASAGPAIRWQPALSPQVFAQAEAQHRYVLLDLHAVWCHWCHVMDTQTYVDPAVVKLIGEHYIAVGVDADSSPELSARYGDWGWPATIVLAANGSEIVKRRGFIAPENMASMLQAIVDDPSPGPSVQPVLALRVTTAATLSAALTAQVALRVDDAYDQDRGGWGNGQKFLDAGAMSLLLEAAAQGDAKAKQRAQQTLDANLHLLDPEWGGVYQYSDKPDWLSPHFEKIMSYQADDLSLYSRAYALWPEPRYLAAAQAIRGYLKSFLTSPQGAFYVSQDADLNATVTGHDYYALSGKQRRALGLPRVDKHVYARESGWAIAALCRFGEATHDASALKDAARAAHWIQLNRALPGGGYAHDAMNTGGPYLADTLAMGEAFLALYRATNDHVWLKRAGEAVVFIEKNFHDAAGGWDTAPATTGARGVLNQAVRVLDENVAVTRLASGLWRESGDDPWRASATHGISYVAHAAAAAPNAFMPGVLLASREFSAAAQAKK